MRFPQDYSKEELAKLVLFHHKEHVKIATKFSNLKEKHIQISKELSELKRK